jgi:hypothetical protein
MKEVYLIAHFVQTFVLELIGFQTLVFPRKSLAKFMVANLQAVESVARPSCSCLVESLLY